MTHVQSDTRLPVSTTASMTGPGKHATPDQPETRSERLRDILSARTLVPAIGVLILQFGFILSYLGAFHAPAAHHIPVTVVAPQQVTAQVVDRLNTIAGQPVQATGSTDAVAARQSLQNGETSAVYLVDSAGNSDHLLVASGGGTSVTTAVETLFTSAAHQQHRELTVEDVVPLNPGDGRGLSGFYLVIGWAVGGYLFASILGIAKGSRPASLPRAFWRVGATVPYALLSGLGGALIAEQALGALGGNFWEIAGIGMLVTLSGATVTIALQTLFGVIGIGLTLLIFVILGNPSAGGAYQPALLPPFWRALSGALPNGAATDALRRIVYFGGHGAGNGVAVLAAWIIGGTLVALTAAAIIYRDSTRGGHQPALANRAAS